MDAPVVQDPPLPRALGEFRIHALLGQGGSGMVYDATWGPRRVALKVLHPSLIGTERGRAQFVAEAQRLQAIQHPSVVKVLAVGALPDGRPYLAMERLEGETLAQLLSRGPLPLAEALTLFAELCGATGALHDQGLIHRDLKPENVFIVAGRHAVLLDFGIAKELAAPASTTTIDGGVRGTPAYMAPERFFGQPAGVATDLYELAVTLYAMLAGELPWDDLADPEARLNPRPLAGGSTEIPAELDVEIRRALSTRAQNRPPSAAAFLEAVQRAAGAPIGPAASETARLPSSAGHPVQAAPQTGPRTVPWFAERRNTTDRGRTPLAWAPTENAPAAAPQPSRPWWPIAVGAVVVVAAVIGIGIVIAQLDDEPDGAGAGVVATEGPSGAADPWGKRGASSSGSGASGSAEVPRPTAALAEIPVSGDELSAAAARAEVAAAIRHVPADTQVLLAVLVGELRRNDQYDRMLAKLSTQARVIGLLDLLPCLRPIVSGSEWAIYASPNLEEGHHGTLIVRGRWRRADIERCFNKDIQPLVMNDGKKMLQMPRLGWIDFIDEHTVYLSVREDLAAAQVHDLAMHGKGPTAKTKALLASLPAGRTLTAVVDGTGLEYPNDDLPKGTHATAWAEVETSGTALDIMLDTGDAKSAQRLVDQVKPTLDDLFKERESRLLGSLEVRRDATVFRITGRLTSLMIGMIGGQL